MVMDWAVDTTGLIITSGTCCGQEAQSMSDTSGGRSGTKLLVDSGPDLRRSRLASNSWMCRTSNSSTADLHVEWQPVLSITSVSSSEGVMLHRVIVALTQCGITASELETLAMDRTGWCSAVDLLSADCVITRQLINCFCCSVAPLHCLHCLLASRSLWLLSSPLNTTMFCHNAVTNRLNCLILTGACLTVFNYVYYYTVSGKKGATLFLPVTPRNSNRLSKFFYHHALQ